MSFRCTFRRYANTLSLLWVRFEVREAHVGTYPPPRGVLIEKSEQGFPQDFCVIDGVSWRSGFRPKFIDLTREPIVHEIVGWKEDINGPTICWLSGPTGSGKSVVSQTVAEFCANEKSLGGSFFFVHGVGRRGKNNHLVTTLAYQITRSIPEVARFVDMVVQSDPLVVYQSIQDQLQRLILAPLMTLPAAFFKNRTLLIVIDAIDECAEWKHIKELVRCLADAGSSRQIPLRWLLTSRNSGRTSRLFSDETVSRATKFIAFKAADTRALPMVVEGQAMAAQGMIINQALAQFHTEISPCVQPQSWRDANISHLKSVLREVARLEDFIEPYFDSHMIYPLAETAPKDHL
ncbi:hypothetical protein HWV62_17034 [Athelia sp. TMB]|nr:hypothetical protein HWV62_17034 [Athelia sp. TMB]